MSHARKERWHREQIGFRAQPDHLKRGVVRVLGRGSSLLEQGTEAHEPRVNGQCSPSLLLAFPGAL